MKIKGVEKRRREITDEIIGATGKRVFLVEGVRDRGVINGRSGLSNALLIIAKQEKFRLEERSI